MHPLLNDFLTPRLDYENSIRVHCPERGQRVALVDLVHKYIPDFHENDTIDPEPGDENFVYFFCRDFGDDEEHGPGLGFDAYNHANSRTYNFDDFVVRLGYDEVDDDIGDMEGVL
jgi:hypothetical protein